MGGSRRGRRVDHPHVLPTPPCSIVTEMRFNRPWEARKVDALARLATLDDGYTRVAKVIPSDPAIIKDLSCVSNCNAAKLCVQDDATVRLRDRLREDMESLNAELEPRLKLKFAENATILGPGGEALGPDGNLVAAALAAGAGAVGMEA